MTQLHLMYSKATPTLLLFLCFYIDYKYKNYNLSIIYIMDFKNCDFL